MRVLDLPQVLKERRQFGFLDDFEWYISPHRWTSLVTGAGASVSAGAAATGGAAVLTTGAVLDNEAALGTTNAIFKMADDKPLLFEARIQYSEANTNKAAFVAGFSDVLTTTLMLPNGSAGIKASFTGAVIYKLANETVFRSATSKVATQTLSVSTMTAGGAAPQTLRIEVQPVDATNGEVTYFIDNNPLLDANGQVIKHVVAFASAVAMQAGFFGKAGSASSEVFSVDYVAAYQLR